MPSNETTKILADRLSDLIAESGKDLREISDEVGISPASLSYYTNDLREAGIGAIAKLSRYFQVTSDYLLGLSDNRTVKAASIGKETGLSDNAIEVLKHAFDEKEYLIKTNDPAAEYCATEIISLIIEYLNFHPGIFDDLSIALSTNFDPNFGKSLGDDIESYILDRNNDIYDKIYENGTVIIGESYKIYLFEKLKFNFELLIKDIVTSINPSKYDIEFGNMRYENPHTLIKNICNFLEFRKEQEKEKTSNADDNKA